VKRDGTCTLKGQSLVYTGQNSDFIVIPGYVHKLGILREKQATQECTLWTKC
jgi:hypothetical protein